MIKATTPEDPKAIEAARFVLSQTGYDDSGSDPGANNGAGAGVPARVVLILAELARKRESDPSPGEYIDAE